MSCGGIIGLLDMQLQVKIFLITRHEVRDNKLLRTIANHLRNNAMLHETKELDNRTFKQTLFLFCVTLITPVANSVAMVTCNWTKRRV